MPALFFMMYKQNVQIQIRTKGLQLRLQQPRECPRLQNKDQLSCLQTFYG